MERYDTLSPIGARGTVVALGYFDGVHLGHRSVLHAAQEMAQREDFDDAVFTFTLPALALGAAGTVPTAPTPEPSDDAVQSVALSTAGKGCAIFTQNEKRRRMEACGVQHYFCPPFEAFCHFTPAQFVDEILVRCLRARAVFCGDNFTFGVEKSGDVALLRTLCAARGIGVHVVNLAHYAGESVSSSRIRAALSDGDMAAANAMLGEPYQIDFPVQHGRQLGRTLGFPTLNQVYPAHMLVPQQGVYLTRTFLTDARGAQAWHTSATGLGTRPTVTGDKPDTGVTCETFVVDYTGDLYGAHVSVEFHAYWKPTRQFDTLDALKHYIAQAAAAARAYFPPQGK